MARSPEQFRRALLRKLGRAAARQARSKIPSRTLRNALRVIVEPNNRRVRLYIPHYWAVYLHDGRAPFGPRNAKVLVFFRNPREDPRLEGGYPVRASQIKKLTRAQWLEGLRRNREAAKAGAPAPMIVIPNLGRLRAGKPTRRRVGRQHGSFFFTKGMASFPREASRIIRAEFSAFVRECFVSRRRERQRVVIRL